MGNVHLGRGQAGLEYAALVGLVLFVALPLAYYAYLNASVQANIAQAEIAAGKISAAADLVAASGPGAKTAVEVYFPPGVANVTFQGREILFSVRTASGGTADVYRVTQANLTPATLTTLEGDRVFLMAFASSGNLTLSPIENASIATTTTTTSTTSTTLASSPPSVFLLSPATGNDSRNQAVNFSFLSTDNDSLANATLYSNFSGSWGANQSNQTALLNNTAAFINLTNVPEGYYVWNVRACDSQSNSTCAFNSSNRTLQIDVTPPAAPTQTGPANGSSGGKKPDFAWNAVADVSNPVTYWLQVSQDPSFPAPFDVDQNTSSTDYQVPSNLANDAQFYWRVRATDAVGNIGPWSPVWWYQT